MSVLSVYFVYEDTLQIRVSSLRVFEVSLKIPSNMCQFSPYIRSVSEDTLQIRVSSLLVFEVSLKIPSNKCQFSPYIRSVSEDTL